MIVKRIGGFMKMGRFYDISENIWFNGVLPILCLGGIVAITYLVPKAYEQFNQNRIFQELKILESKSKVIIPNITRDGIIDSTEKADFYNMMDSFIEIYNGKQNKISSLADINGDGIIDSTEKAGLHKTIDSVIESYNTKSKMGAPTNNEKSNLYKIIDSVNKRYDSKKIK